uniref:Inhibitor of growth protein n=1 Tax=Macrostomum lignano TaxID=282301 RepID=A0A1I8FL74_9PLAT
RYQPRWHPRCTCEHYLDSLESLPADLERNFNLIRDHGSEGAVNSGRGRGGHAKYLTEARLWRKAERADKAIGAFFSRGAVLADEKVQLAMQTYEMVDRHIRRLDTDLARFEAELKERANRAAKGGGAAGVGASGGGGGADAVDGGDDGAGEPSGARRGRKRRQRADADNGADAAWSGTAASTADDAASQLPPSGLPITAALTLTLTNNPAEVLDMPVDPNEPTYCICHQVSYGDMIGCDNVDCPIEWFHFNCVGLSTKPKGKWFCPKCQDARKHKKMSNSRLPMSPEVQMLLSAVVLLSGVHLSAAFPDGAPNHRCSNLVPMHGFQPQTSAPPYELTFSPDRYSPGQTVQGEQLPSRFLLRASGSPSQRRHGELVGGFEGAHRRPVGGFWYSQNASLPNCLTHSGLPQSGDHGPLDRATSLRGRRGVHTPMQNKYIELLDTGRIRCDFTLPWTVNIRHLSGIHQAEFGASCASPALIFELRDMSSLAYAKYLQRSRDGYSAHRISGLRRAHGSLMLTAWQFPDASGCQSGAILPLPLMKSYGNVQPLASASMWVAEE